MSVYPILHSKQIKLSIVLIACGGIVVLQNIMPLTQLWATLSILTGLGIYAYFIVQKRFNALPRHGWMILVIIMIIALNIHLHAYHLVFSIQALLFTVLGLILVTTFTNRHKHPISK